MMGGRAFVVSSNDASTSAQSTVNVMLESVDAGDLGQVPIVRRKFAQIIARVTEDA